MGNGIFLKECFTPNMALSKDTLMIHFSSIQTQFGLSLNTLIGAYRMLLFVLLLFFCHIISWWGTSLAGGVFHICVSGNVVGIGHLRRLLGDPYV